MIEFVISLILLLNPIAAPAAPNIFNFSVQESGPQKIQNGNMGVKLTASNFIAKDVESGAILYSSGENEQTPLASLTKLMTALVFSDTNPEWQSQIELTQKDETDGAYPHVYRGEKVTIENLFNSMLISSDNNSAEALVRSTGLSSEKFVERMNMLAANNDLKQTHFVDPTGLSAENVSSAADVARLLELAVLNDDIRKALSHKTYSFDILNSNKIRKIYTTNQLLDSFLNSEKSGYAIIGGKTGFLPEAGGCLAVMIEKDGRRIISVVLGSSNYDTRFQDTKALVDWVFLNYQWE
ncbi:MAG: D-alanyl-D-alanine carboxypeptidase family protein [Patescibacteria group bacterium]